MEVDPNQESGNATSGPGSVTVLLHPLVILNISEHWTRNKVKENSTAIVVFGSLLGKQEGHHVEISNSFELLLDEPHMTINAEFYNTRELQCKKVYPDLDIVGWYTTGGAICEKDELFNRQLDPLQACGEQLPVRVYESVVDNDGRVHFRQVTYQLATDEAERIGVDCVARISSTGRISSMTAENLLSNYQAIQMLCNRLQLIRSYVGAVAAGELPINRARLREISALIKRLPLLTSSDSNSIPNSTHESHDHLYRQANDVCLTALLANMTQGLHTLYGCMVKTTQMIDRRSMPMNFGGEPISGGTNYGGFVKMSHFLGHSS